MDFSRKLVFIAISGHLKKKSTDETFKNADNLLLREKTFELFALPWSWLKIV